MKKKILAVILSIMVAISVPTAIVGAYYTLPLDVGNFNRYNNDKKSSSRSKSKSRSRSSSKSSSSKKSESSYSYDSSSRSSSRSSTGTSSSSEPISPIIFGTIIVAVILIYASNKINSLKNKKMPESSNNIPKSHMPYDCTGQITAFMKQTDPDFSAEKFIAWSKNIFITLQNAWTERDWEKVRTLEKEELFEQHNTQLQEYIRLGRINVLERINVNQAFLHKYVRDENYEHLTVCMDVRMLDYIIDEKSGKVLMGSNKEDCHMTYLLVFIRSKGVKSNIMKGVVSASCPHCGAPVDSASAGRCEYCGSVIHSGEYNWVLSDMQAVDENTSVDNRGIVLLDDNKQ